MKYILVDAANTFSRASKVVRASDPWTMLGMALHITINSINKAFTDFSGDHVIVCLEGKSWRKDFYKPYKYNRLLARSARTQAEEELDNILWAGFDDFVKMLDEKTNVTVIQNSIAEADDLIARFIATHPDDEHVIISSDSDFYQLINKQVTQYNGVQHEHITVNGIFNEYGKPIIDKKTKQQKTIGDPEWLLFEKCMRGDKSDYVFSAYPGVRTKGTKNKVGLQEAFNDRHTKGYSWNNLMLQRWTDGDEKEHRVLDDYQRNVTLIDLSAIPLDIRNTIDTYLANAIQRKQNPMVGVVFMKFCGKYELNRAADQATTIVKWLSAAYPEAK